VQPAPSKLKRGRPRSAKTKAAILEAAFDLFRELGYSELTIEGVAARAQCGKATIYRWWPSKGSLVLEAFLGVDGAALPYPETGSVREDFRRQMQLLAQLLQSDQGKLLANLLGSGQQDPDLIHAFRAKFLEARRAEAARIFHRGIRSGELRPGLFLETAFDALYGPLFFRLLTDRTRLTPDYVDALCDGIMTGFTQH